MNELRKNVDMGFTKKAFPEGTHMCLIYNNDEHRKKIISRFLASGIALGEQVSYFADVTSPAEVDGWLKEMGVDVTDVKNRGAFDVFNAREIYCPGGRFLPEDMLGRLANYHERAIKAGYNGARLSGEMSWALRGIPGSDRLMEYEALINTISEKHPVTPICQYDARRFDGATLLHALKVHPLMIVEGQIVQNPYYMPPQEFLAEFRGEK